MSSKGLSQDSYVSKIVDKVSRFYFYRILVVEDSFESQQILDLAMDTVPCRVDYAVNGEEAIHYLEKNLPYDLIILDQDLPDTEGLRILSAADKIQDEAKEREMVPYIVYSGLDLKHVEKLNNFSLADFIKKPTDIHTIHKRITEVLFNRKKH